MTKYWQKQHTSEGDDKHISTNEEGDKDIVQGDKDHSESPRDFGY